MIKNKKVVLAVYIAITLALTNGLDLLYSVLIRKGKYQFNIATDLIIPVCVAITVGLFLFMSEKPEGGPEEKADEEPNEPEDK